MLKSNAPVTCLQASRQLSDGCQRSRYVEGGERVQAREVSDRGSQRRYGRFLTALQESSFDQLPTVPG